MFVARYATRVKPVATPVLVELTPVTKRRDVLVIRIEALLNPTLFGTRGSTESVTIWSH
jgi:hypothetical protein